MLKKFKSMINMVLLLSAAVAITSCEKTEGDDFEYVAPSGKLAGEWFVTVKDKAAPTVNVVNYRKILTFNSVAANNELWIQGSNASTAITGLASYGVKVKATSAPENFTFSVENGTNTVASTAGTVTVVGGKVFPGQGKSITGKVVDSIYMEIQYSTKPGQTFIMSGHQRSGFPADEPTVK